MDIRELRIGSSASYDGERVKITAIDYSGGEPFVLIDNKEIWVSSWMHTTMLNPIPITEELLKELGFEVRALTFRLKAEKYLSEYDEFLMLERAKGKDKFEVYIYLSKEETHKTHLKYLHELETFVYLTTKQELI